MPTAPLPITIKYSAVKNSYFPERRLPKIIRASLFGIAVVTAAMSSPVVCAANKNLQAIATQSYNIPAGPLGRTLSVFAVESGIALSFDPVLTEGRTSLALQGNYSASDAIVRLLSGSGLEIVARADGSYTLQKLPVDAETTLETVRVKAGSEQESANGPVNGYVARRSATGTKTNTKLIEIPQSISVIGTQEMEDQGVITLTDALQHTPGVSVNIYGYDSRAQDWVNLRGFDGWYSSSYRDGLGQSPGITFIGTQTEVYGLERIEVLRGPASVLFGKGDVGGVINRVSKVPSANTVNEIGMQIGSHDRRQVNLDVGGSIDANNAVIGRIVALSLDTNTQEKYPNGDKPTQERQYLAPSLRWQIGDNTSLVLQAEWLRDEVSDDIQYVTAFDGEPTRIKEGDPHYSRMKIDSNAAGYQLEHQVNDVWSLRQYLRFSYRTSDKHHVLSWLDVPVTLARQARFDQESVRELAVDTSIHGSAKTGNIDHELLFGIDWDNTRADWNRETAMAPSLDMANPLYDGSIPEPDDLVANMRVTSKQLGLYTQDQIRFDSDWLLTLGLRHDRVETETDDRLAISEINQTDPATTGRVGLTYLVGNGWAPYMSYAESFIPNTGVDANNDPFDPSRGKQVEVGIKYLPDSAPIVFSAALFDLRKTKVVTYDAVTFDARQIGSVRSRGIELETKAELSTQLRLTTAYTYLDMEVLKSANSIEVGQIPILIPEQTASLWLEYTPDKFLRGFGFGMGPRYLGKRWNDEANTSAESGVTLFDATIHYDIAAWRLALNASNLFNKYYYSGRAYGSYFIGAERNLVASATYQF